MYTFINTSSFKLSAVGKHFNGGLEGTELN
jgi:hypothetical protein